MQQNKPAFAAVGRVLIALVFIASGLSKLTTPAATQDYIASVGFPLPVLGYFVALAVEIGGGLLLLAGFQARVVAVALAQFSFATAVLFHHHFADKNQLINFLKNIMIAGGLLQIIAFGAPRFSLDARKAGATA